MMKRLIPVLGVMVALLAVSAGPGFAADPPQPALTVKSVTAQAFPELQVNRTAAATGMVETLRHEGKVLVSVDAEVLAEWTEEIQNARVESKDIKLILDGGAEVLMTGYFERFGDFRVSSNSFYDYRRSDWKEKPQSKIFNAVFAVPEGTASAKLQLGPVSAKVAIPDKVLPPPDPASLVTVEVVEAAYVDCVRNTRSISGVDPKPATLVTAVYGNLLKIQLRVTPKRPNGDDPNHFFWLTNWISLTTQDGHFVPVVGEMFMEHLNDYVSHNLSKGSDGGWSSNELDMYFLVPVGTTAYTLTFLSAPVAKGQLQAPAAAEEPAAPSKEDKAKGAIKNLMNKVKTQ